MSACRLQRRAGGKYKLHVRAEALLCYIRQVFKQKGLHAPQALASTELPGSQARPLPGSVCQTRC